MQHSQMLDMPKNAIWLCFHHQLLKSALETQIKAYAAFAKVHHTEKRYLALFSSSTFEIFSITQILAYSVFANVQHA